MDYISFGRDGQEVTLQAEEVLQDDRFAWRWRKVKTWRLAALYEQAGMNEYATRARTCATWLKYGVSENGEKQLSAANFCQLRLCPMCIARRAKKSAYRLSRVLDMVEQQHGAKYIFLTLTMRNVEGPELGDALARLTKGWDRLCHHRQFQRSIHGWFRSIEITRGRGNRDKGYHPHLHAILAVEPGYFWRSSKFYITHGEWVKRWRRAIGADYDPSVRIQTTRAKDAKAASVSAAAEAGKYAVKDEEYIDPELTDDQAVEILVDYTRALHRRRLTAMGGWMKDAARALDMPEELEDGDLVHLEDETIREDVAELIEIYHWSFGVGDYILASREINPLRVHREPEVIPKPEPVEREEQPEEPDLEDDMFKFWQHE